MIGYGFFIWISFIPNFLIYFRLICLNIEGLMGYHSDWLAFWVMVSLVVGITFIRMFHFGEEALAFGGIGIAGYMLFILWAILTRPEGD